MEIQLWVTMSTEVKRNEKNSSFGWLDLCMVGGRQFILILRFVALRVPYPRANLSVQLGTNNASELQQHHLPAYKQILTYMLVPQCFQRGFTLWFFSHVGTASAVRISTENDTLAHSEVCHSYQLEARDILNALNQLLCLLCKSHSVGGLNCGVCWVMVVV